MWDNIDDDENNGDNKVGDVDNNGIYEIIATDMKPYKENPIWIPPLKGTGSMQSNDGIQFLSNTLYFKVDDKKYHYLDLGKERGIDATGWSWSVQFGDLDNDGFLDLYIVNGMHNEDLFGHLPGNELIENNKVFKNNGTGHFISKDEWNLDSTESGRGMSIADLDNDGNNEIIFGSNDGKLYILDAYGNQELAYVQSGVINGSPAIVDLDLDGDYEIIFTTYGGINSNGEVYAIHHDGNDVDGFPIGTDEKMMVGAAVGDLEGDGYPEIVICTWDDNIYAIDNFFYIKRTS